MRRYHIIVSHRDNGKVRHYTSCYTLIGSIRLANQLYREFDSFLVEVYKQGKGLLYTAHGFTE